MPSARDPHKPTIPPDMKKLHLFVLAALLIAPVAARSQTTIFNDNFSSSTLNPTPTSPGTTTATQTAYEIGSAKTATGTTIAGNALTLSTSSTSSGFTEAQALFTHTPVTLSAPGQYIEIFCTFKDPANVLNGTAGNGTGPYIGIYNSGGSGPTNGTALWSSGLTQNVFTATNGAAAGWAGYGANFIYSSNSLQAASIFSRPPQTQLTNSCQELLFGSTFLNHTNLTTLGGVMSQPSLTVNSIYTLALVVTYSNSACLGVTETLYNGAGTGGTVFSSGGFTATMTGAATNTTAGTGNGPVFTFDAMAIGYRAGATAATTFPVTNIEVIDYLPAAPAISGLVNETVIAGNSTNLSPTVSGVPTPSYQWQTNGVNIPGATSSSLSLNNVQYSQNGYVYSLVASNFVGAVTNSMTLTVIVTPSITGLGNQAAYIGDTVTISPTVAGVPTPSYQWQSNGVSLTDGLDANGSTVTGSATSTLQIANAQAADSGTYSLIASNSAGSVTNSMTLLVSAANTLPIITGPANITVNPGNNGTFSASVSGLPAPTLQWLDQTGTPIPGATNSFLTLTNVQFSQNGFVYSLVGSNVVGSVTNSATLTVNIPPVISGQPTNQTVTTGQPASFTVVASGVPNPTYQWYKNNSPVSSAANATATNATFTLATTAPADSGSAYYVQISNSAGTTNSATVTLTVYSAMTTTAFTPANGATGLCYDTPLTVTFSAAPTLGAAGSIKIFSTTNSTTPVDTISAAAGAVQQRTFPGDGQSFSYKTIVIVGSTVTIYPHAYAMSSNQTYYVTIDPGTFTDAAGAGFAGITATNVWQFATKVGGPVNANSLVVNADGTGDFLTVQGAVNSVPGGNTTPCVINVRNGLYTEIVDVAGRNNITIRGQSRLGTLIGYPNNATFQVANSGTTHARMAVKVNANDIAFDNLTVTNMTPQGGSQAEALMIETGAARCIVNNCDIVSRQDTILANVTSSQAYFNNSAVRGNFDYIWGGGNLYFNQCVMDTIGGASGYNLTAARTGTAATVSTNFPWVNPAATYSANGMSFVNCSFLAESGVSSVTLAGSNGTSNNLVSWSSCQFAASYVTPSASLFNGNFIFWQNQNTDLTGVTPVTYSTLTTIGGADVRLLAATNAPVWLYGWVPQLAPNILTNPVSQSINGGGTAVFTVAATGIPAPSYQWLKNGSPIAGQTGASLSIATANANNTAAYSVIVSNLAGVVTSGSANLAVSNTAPSLAPAANQTVNVGANVSAANLATDPDVPAQSLTFTLPVAPSGATVDGSGNLTWRPTVGFAGTINPVQVVVTYNGTPGLSATNNFTVTVNPLTSPATTVPTFVAGVFSVTVNGQAGPDYELQATTNLDGGTWVSVATTNSPASPFLLTDPNAGAQPGQFYRIVTGPPLP